MQSQLAASRAQYSQLESRYNQLRSEYDDVRSRLSAMRAPSVQDCPPCEASALPVPGSADHGLWGPLVLVALAGAVVWAMCTLWSSQGRVPNPMPRLQGYGQLDEKSKAEARPPPRSGGPSDLQSPSRLNAVAPTAGEQLGRLKVLLQRAEGLKASDGVFGKSDPYVILRAGIDPSKRHSLQEKRSSTIKQDLNPIWNEAVEFAGTKQQFLMTGLQLNVFDWDRHSEDDPLGAVHLPLTELESKRREEYAATLPAPFKGTVFLTVEWVPDGSPQTAAQPNGGGGGDRGQGGGGHEGGGGLRGGREGGGGGNATSGPAIGPGVFRIIIKRAENLKGMDWNGRSDPYVVLQCLRQTEKTSVVKYTLNPVWNETVEFRGLRQELLRSGLRLQVMDWDKRTQDDLLGEAHLPLLELEQANHSDYTVPLPTKGTVYLAVEWLPDDPAPAPSAAANAASSYFASRKRGTPPTQPVGGARTQGASPTLASPGGAGAHASAPNEAGRMQLLLERAAGLKKADFMGKSDPYVILQCLGVEQRSTVKKQDLNPVWNERFEFHGRRDAFVRAGLQMRLFDKDMVGSDDPLGDAWVSLASLSHTDYSELNVKLPHPYTGTVSITITWLPDRPSAGVEEAASSRGQAEYGRRPQQSPQCRAVAALEKGYGSARNGGAAAFGGGLRNGGRRNTLDVAD